ncbi:hypothetical protein GCM10009099_14120 [Caenispirillum bisanense]
MRAVRGGQRHDAGIVDDHVDAPEPLPRRLGEGGHIGAVGDVQAPGQHRAAEVPGQGLQALRAAGAEGEPGAGAGQGAGDAGTDTAGGAGDEDDLVDGHG